MIKKLSIASLLVLLAACGANSNRSGPGVILTETTDAVFVDNNYRPMKKGEACSTRILVFVATGDASVAAAKRDGGISKVATIDTEHYNILGVYGKACTIVRGE